MFIFTRSKVLGENERQEKPHWGVSKTNRKQSSTPDNPTQLLLFTAQYLKKNCLTFFLLNKKSKNPNNQYWTLSMSLKSFHT